MSRSPHDNRDNEAESPGDGLRDEIEEILREQGEKPVMPRPPRARGGGPVNSLAGMVRNMGAGGVDGSSFRSVSGALLRTAMALLLLRLAVGLVFAFFAVRILGPRAILLFIAIGLAIIAVMILRYVIARRRDGR